MQIWSLILAKVDPFVIQWPQKWMADSEIRPVIEYLNRFLHDLFLRTGGGDDVIETSEDQTNILRSLAISNATIFKRKQVSDLIDDRVEVLEVRPHVSHADIFNLSQQLSGSGDKIEAIEVDLSTRPRMSDVSRANQRINQLIDELITEIRAIAPDVELENKALCLQVQTLEQLKLLNLRTEEAFETDLNEDDL